MYAFPTRRAPHTPQQRGADNITVPKGIPLWENNENIFDKNLLSDVYSEIACVVIKYVVLGCGCGEVGLVGSLGVLGLELVLELALVEWSWG